MKDKKSEKVKKRLLSLASGVALVVIIWLLFFSRTKAISLISPWIEKIPKDENKLTELTEKILGKAAEVVGKGNLKKVTEKSSEFFEESQYAQPAREIRENVVQRINEVVESVKELPAQEVKIIKRQVCKEWFEEIATQSADQ